MVRKQNTIEYPYFLDGCLFYGIFFLSLEVGTTSISHFRYSYYDKRRNKDNNADAQK